MEEALEAAAIAIKYVGEAIISSKCAELLVLVEGVEQAAEAAGLQHEEISRLGDKLKQANERDRMTAVVNLGDACGAMERAASAPLMTLRDSTASLVRECRDFQEAYQCIDKLRHSKVQQAQNSGDQPRGSGWLSIWGRLGTRQGTRENLLTDVEKGHQELEDSFAVTVDLLLTKGRLLKEKRANLLNQANDVTVTANGAGVSYLCVELLRAMDVMEQADEAYTLSSVVDLEAAATAMEGTISSLPNVLRDKATELMRACMELKRAHDAIITVQQAAAEQREARIAGEVVVHREGSVAGVAAASGQGEQPGLGQGESKRSAMTAYALYGSVTLITYLGPKNVTESVKGFAECFRKLFHIVFSIWWTLQAGGVPVSAYARSLAELRCSQLLCRLGVLGINLLVIVFLYLALDIDSVKTLACLLGGALLLHILSFVLVCRRGDLSK